MRVLWSGLGKFGRPMAEWLLRSGHEVLLPASTHARQATAELVAAGARPASATDTADVCGVCLPTPDDVAEVLAPLDRRQVGFVVDFSTGHPSAARAQFASLAERGIRYLDAPVSGSIDKAGRGELTIWAGTDARSTPAPVVELLDALGANVYPMGSVGAGSAMKLVNQVVHCLTMVAVGEGVSLARCAGIDAARAIASMTTSSADSAMLRRFGGSLVEDDFTPQFALRLALKDIRYAAAEATAHGVDLAHLHRLEQDLSELADLGLGEWNFSAVAAGRERVERLRAEQVGHPGSRGTEQSEESG